MCRANHYFMCRRNKPTLNYTIYTWCCRAVILNLLQGFFFSHSHKFISTSELNLSLISCTNGNLNVVIKNIIAEIPQVRTYERMCVHRDSFQSISSRIYFVCAHEQFCSFSRSLPLSFSLSLALSLCLSLSQVASAWALIQFYKTFFMIENAVTDLSPSTPLLLPPPPPEHESYCGFRCSFAIIITFICVSVAVTMFIFSPLPCEWVIKGRNEKRKKKKSNPFCNCAIRYL